MTRKLLICGLALLASGFLPALAQVQPKAAALLEKAKTAHGGKALANLRGLELKYQSVSLRQKSTTIFRDLIGFQTQQILHQSIGPGGVWNESLIGPTQAASWRWNFKSKQLEEESVYSTQAIFPLYFWITGLHWGASQRQAVGYLGVQVWEGIKGEVVMVNSKQVSVKLLLGPDGTLLAEEVLAEGRYIYSDYIVQNGIKFPRKSILYVNSKPVAHRQVLEFKPLQSLANSAFSLNPKPYTSEFSGWKSDRTPELHERIQSRP